MSTDLLNHVYETSAQIGNRRAVLLALSWKADDAGQSYPSIETLAKMTALHSRTVQKIVSELVADGELEVQTGAGPFGANLFRVITARGRQLVLVGGASMNTPATGAPNTPVPLVSLTKATKVRGVLGAHAGTPHKPLSAAAEVREIQLRSGALWLSLRQRPGLDRFTDTKALRWLKASIGRALLGGAEWRDIESGIRAHARDEKANPWYADEWIRVTSADRRERENTNRKMAERSAERPRAIGLHGIGGAVREITG